MENRIVSGPRVDPAAAELQEAFAALDRQARSSEWLNPEWRHAMAQTLHDQVWWGFQHENILQYFTTVESVEEGDQIVIEEMFGLEVFWVALGGNIDQSDITSTRWEMKQDYVGFHVNLFESVIRQQFSSKSQMLVRSAITEMDAAVNARAFRTFQRAIPSSSDSYISGAGVLLDDIDESIAACEEESLSGEVSIIGRRGMIDQIMNAVRDSNLYAPQTNEDILRTGMMGTYRGVPLIKLKNFRDRRKRSYFPNNELFVVAKDASKAGFWGGLETREGSEQLGWHWHYLGRRSAGFAVWRPESCRRIVDTSRSA